MDAEQPLEDLKFRASLTQNDKGARACMNKQFERNEPHRTQVEENPFVLSIMLVLISAEACPFPLFIRLTN